MKLTKRQLAVVEKLHGDAWIWMAGSHAYLAERDTETGRVNSTLIHTKVFNSLKESGVIAKNPDNDAHYILAT